MSRPLEVRLAKLEVATSPPDVLLFLEAGEDEGGAIAARQAAAPHSRIVVLRWAETDAEAISDPAKPPA